MKPSEGMVTGRPLATDSDSISASNSLPAFLARPAGAPVYHGFKIRTDVVVDGFTLGMITDFEAEPVTEGDAFVIHLTAHVPGWLGVCQTSRTLNGFAGTPMTAGASGLFRLHCQCPAATTRDRISLVLFLCSNLSGKSGDARSRARGCMTRTEDITVCFMPAMSRAPVA